MTQQETNHCQSCANLHCREVQRRSVDLKIAGCGEWREDRTQQIIEDKERGKG